METIVVGIDGSGTADRAAREAAELAARLGATLHVVTAVKKHGGKVFEAAGETWHLGDFDTAEDHIAALRTSLGDQPKTSSAVVYGDPADALIDEARRVGADIIVVGNRRVRGASRVMGAVASAVVRGAPCAVYVAKTT